jgi:hypothetical protein
MARLNNGNLQGIAGPLEFYLLKGKPVVRSKRIKSNKPPTPKQLNCRGKMKFVVNFLKDMVPFVNEGYANPESDYPYSDATSYLLLNAVTGNYPDYSMNYSKVKLTTGTLSNTGLNPQAKREDNKVIISWTSDTSPLHFNDRLMALVYAPALNQVTYIIAGAMKHLGTDTLTLPNENWKSIELYAYVSFMSAKTKECSDSIFLQVND